MTEQTELGSTTALATILTALARTIDGRVGADPAASYTARLLSEGPLICGKKIADEGAELALALAAQGADETVEEAADLLYHMLVGLRSKAVSLDAVARALAARQGLSGLIEKANRTE